MEKKIIVKILLETIDDYEQKRINLNYLSQRGENLIEHIKSMDSSEIYDHAMNCIYIIEVVNAVILDEDRPMSASEKITVDAQLNEIKRIFIAEVD